MIVKISKNYLILLLITSCGIISLFMLHLFQSYQLRLSILRDRQPGAQHRAIPLIKSFTTAITSSTHTRCHNSTLFSVPIGNYTQRAALLTCSIDDAIRLSKIAQDLSGRMVPYKHDSMIIQDGVPNTGILFLYDRRDIDPCYVHYISLKYNPSCGHDKSLRPRFIKPLLIVAVQRSGTHYMWEMLQRLGVDVHHEGVGQHGAVSWLYAVNSHGNSTDGVYDYGHGYIINNPEALHRNRFRLIFHQVRHPLRVISTLLRCCSSWDRYWQWIQSLRGFEQIVPQLTPLKRAMLLYLLWNRHIQQYADLRYRSEVTSARDVCIWAGLQEFTDCYGAYKDVTHTHLPRIPGNISITATTMNWNKKVDNRVNSLQTTPKRAHPLHTVSWEDLDGEDVALSNELKVMCLEYDYPLDPALTPQAEHTRNFTA